MAAVMASGAETDPSMIDLEELKQDFQSRGYSFDIFIDPPGQQWLGFTHRVDEIVVPLQGQVTLVVDGVRHQPGPGEEVFIPAHTLHDVITSPDAGSRWAYGYRTR
jgi:mannose-6-phosphate isomerase-like protein (cupin superfamily)